MMNPIIKKKQKRNKTVDRQQIFHTLARTIESLGSVDPPMNPGSDYDDLETWCLTEVLSTTELYKSKMINNQK